MINHYAINSYPIGQNYVSEAEQESTEVISSFSAFQKTRYCIKTPLGQYFNIWTFGTYDSWVCGQWDRVRYGNILLDTNIESLSDKEISKSENPILNGGFISQTRFSQKDIEFRIEIKPKDITSFQKEIWDMKKYLNMKGLKILKTEQHRYSEIDVELENIEYDLFSSKGTKATLSFVSLDPNFKKPSGSTKAYRDISWNLDVSLIISDTDESPLLNTLIDIKELTGTITAIQLEFDGYEVEIACDISSPEKVIFDGKTGDVFVWTTLIEDFSWKFMPFPINTPKRVKCSFIWATVEKYSIYFSYDNIYL